MSLLDLTSMLAVDFPFVTASGATNDMEITYGMLTYSANIASGTYRMFLGSSTTDFIQVLNTAIATALFGSGNSLVARLGTDGRLTWTSSGAVTLTPTTDLSRLLGNVSTSAGVSTYPPRHCVLMGSLYGGTWKPNTPGGWAKTTGGRVYGYRAGNTTYERTFRADFIPNDPPAQTSLVTTATPFYPVKASMTALNPTTATDRVWSWMDVLIQAHNSGASLAHGNFQELVAEQGVATTEQYYTGYVGGDLLGEPSPGLQIPEWEALVTCPLTFVLPTTGSSSTRA